MRALGVILGGISGGSSWGIPVGRSFVRSFTVQWCTALFAFVDARTGLLLTNLLFVLCCTRGGQVRKTSYYTSLTSAFSSASAGRQQPHVFAVGDQVKVKCRAFGDDYARKKANDAGKPSQSRRNMSSDCSTSATAADQTQRCECVTRKYFMRKRCSCNAQVAKHTPCFFAGRRTRGDGARTSRT